MRKEIIAFISKELRYENLILIEKDLILNFILYEMNKYSSFKNNYIFKGGTCLIKSHFGYYRFSEDLDFTYKNQKTFSGLSEQRIRKIISQEINQLGKILEEIANNLGLEFKLEKINRKFYEFGGGGRFTTFKLWFRSSISNITEFIKIQINYVDLILFPIIQKDIVLLNKNVGERIFIIFDELKPIKENIKMNTYSLEEITCEKLRSILTRKGIKIRDFLDIYKIHESGIKFSKLENETIKKVGFMLRYEKYRTNLNKNIENMMRFGEEKIVSLEPIPENFYPFSKNVVQYCQKLKEKILEIANI